DVDQAVLVLSQHALSGDQCPLHNGADLFINLTGRLLAIVALLTQLAAKEDHLLPLTQGHGAESLAHAIVSHHLSRHGGNALDVIGRASRYLAEDQPFRYMAA